MAVSGECELTADHGRRIEPCGSVHIVKTGLFEKIGLDQFGDTVRKLGAESATEALQNKGE